MDVRLATSADILSLMTLESRNFVGNLDASERRGGFISVLHTREWFDRAVACEGVHVAVEEDGAVMGFIVVMPLHPGLKQKRHPYSQRCSISL
jgi:hypothetical protein